MILVDNMKTDLSGICKNRVKLNPDEWIEDRTEILKLDLSLSNGHFSKSLLTQLLIGTGDTLAMPIENISVSVG